MSMKQERVEKDLIECKRLLTRAVTDLPEFSTMEKIKANNTEFLRACDRVHKQAQRILIADILDIEKELDQVKAEPKYEGAKSRISQLTYWKRLFELFFNFLLWISVGLDRSNVKKVFKGPKYGSLKYQNVDLTLKFMDSMNQNPDEFVIPLDFCTFVCICDALWKIRDPDTGAFPHATSNSSQARSTTKSLTPSTGGLKKLTSDSLKSMAIKASNKCHESLDRMRYSEEIMNS